MDSRNRFTDDEWSALAAAPAAAAAAMIATGKPGIFGAFKEVRASAKAITALPNEGEGVQLIADLVAYASEHGEDGSQFTSENDDLEASRNKALDAVDQAGRAAAKLEPGELEIYSTWIVGIAQAVAEAASDKGASGPVSEAEAQTLAEVDRRLRRGA